MKLRRRAPARIGGVAPERERRGHDEQRRKDRAAENGPAPLEQRARRRKQAAPPSTATGRKHWNGNLFSLREGSRTTSANAIIAAAKRASSAAAGRCSRNALA